MAFWETCRAMLSKHHTSINVQEGSVNCRQTARTKWFGPSTLSLTGEIKLSNIQKNVKRIMREEFSLFSLGIGFDVDYDFLERIAMDNRGVAQRIYANHDAAEQLRVRWQQLFLKKFLLFLLSRSFMNGFFVIFVTNESAWSPLTATFRLKCPPELPFKIPTW